MWQNLVFPKVTNKIFPKDFFLTTFFEVTILSFEAQRLIICKTTEYSFYISILVTVK